MWTKWIYKDSFEIISKGLLRLFFVIFRHFSSGRSILWQKLFIPNRIKLKISKASFVIKIAFPIGKRIKQTTTWVQIFFKKWTLTIYSYRCGGWIRIQNIGGERGLKQLPTCAVVVVQLADGRAVASNTRGHMFESIPQQFCKKHFLCFCI